MKQVKCKKCKLTYSNKMKECPYCHKKRFKLLPLVLVLILIVAIAITGIVIYNQNHHIYTFRIHMSSN